MKHYDELEAALEHRLALESAWMNGATIPNYHEERKHISGEIKRLVAAIYGKEQAK